MKKQLTSDQKVFILENRLKMSMVDMANHLATTYEMVRAYMKANNLSLTKEEVQIIRVAKLMRNKPVSVVSEGLPKNKSKVKRPEWVRDPWNHGLNLITMR